MSLVSQVHFSLIRNNFKNKHYIKRFFLCKILLIKQLIPCKFFSVIGKEQKYNQRKTVKKPLKHLHATVIIFLKQISFF